MSEKDIRNEFLTQFPVAPGVEPWIGLRVPRPMKPKEWEQFMRVLEAMKPGLVWEEEAES